MRHNHRVMLGVFALALVCAVQIGCGTVREHRRVQQPLGSPITASVGATLFHLDKKGDLPNAFGGRDIYGGKVSKGYAAVKLKRVREDRYVDITAYDVSKGSDETTLDRYRPGVRIEMTQTMDVGNSEGIDVTVDTQKEREFVLAGIRITFLEIRPTSVKYQLDDVFSAKN